MLDSTKSDEMLINYLRERDVGISGLCLTGGTSIISSTTGSPSSFFSGIGLGPEA